MKQKLRGKSPPEDWKEQIQLLLKQKEELKKANNPKFDNNPKEIEAAIAQIKLLQMFLSKDRIDVPLTINPAGEVLNGFLVMPISKRRYVYNWCGLKGIVEAYKPDFDIKRWYLKIEDFEFKIDGEPIESFYFELPDNKVIENWCNNKVNGPTTIELWQKLELYFRTFLDLPEDCLYKVLVLFVFQTWLQEHMNTVFYITIMGQWGGGKSTVLELLSLTSNRGMLGNASTSVIAHAIHEQRVSIFFDELDSASNHEEDNERISILRQGYRKGLPYIRRSSDNTKTIKYDVYGSKAFTSHSTIEPALLQRSIPIIITESTESTLSAVKFIKAEYAKPLADYLYLWYLDNILYIVDTLRCVDYSSIGGDDPKKVRESIWETLSLTYGTTEATSQRYGRSAELSFIMAILAKLLSVDLDQNWTTEVFKLKKEVEEEQQDIGEIAILREFLYRKYTELAVMPGDDWRTPEGYVKISHKQVYEEFSEILRRDKKMFGSSTRDFAGYLRELGFDLGKAKKKLRIRLPNEVIGIQGYPVRLALIFVPSVLKKLGIKEIPRQDRLEVIEEIVRSVRKED